uniref:Putative C1q domain containing protein MgC1q76 n=1 Tax=Mytilus galloprovincialis TaxID=29158 RepID=F0V4B3_MYTGA|nr:putative C1q domain containing protein MgC1q76 [Mytilus galloprovincialis]
MQSQCLLLCFLALVICQGTETVLDLFPEYKIVQRRIDALENDNKVLKVEIDALENDNKALKVEIAQIKDKQIRPAFFSTLSKSAVLSNSNKVLIFDGVKVNRGGGYNPSTGIFTAKRDGLYHFSCVIYGDNGRDVGYQLNKNDLLYVRGYSNTGPHEASSISVLVELKKGDRVYIKHRHLGSTEAVIGNDHSSFPGYFLQD